MGIELLQYQEPRNQDGETQIPPISSVDHWQIDIQVERIRAADYDRAKSSVPSSMANDTSQAFFYVSAQFVGGWLDLALAALPLRMAAKQEKVRHIATVPKPRGFAPALAEEFVTSALGTC